MGSVNFQHTPDLAVHLKDFFFQWKLLSKNCYFNSHACMCNPEATVIKILYTSGGVITLVDGSM